ncbi:nitrilase-related carbon-nitrogen hydrolase [Peribacillus muralis]|uniref:nitrilase-related carbon-nitrogen hydrolase n=1 Tax=Peribacillus muralis TaxID=264697 RepID=UPI0037F2FCDF
MNRLHEMGELTGLLFEQGIGYPSEYAYKIPKEKRFRAGSSWEKAISAHGISNGVFVAATNRVGQEKDMNFYGGSFISDTFGNILASLDDGEGNIVQEINLKDIERTRNMLQFFRDRRSDTYAPILQKEMRPTPSLKSKNLKVKHT